MKPTQSELILAYMKKHGSITPLDALLEIGCFRLGARIWDLKQAGHNIETEMVEVKTRHGGTATVASYSLVTPKQETLFG